MANFTFINARIPKTLAKQLDQLVAEKREMGLGDRVSRSSVIRQLIVADIQRANHARATVARAKS